MNVLVTGSSGFLGKNLVDALNENGFKVKEFDLAEGRDILDKAQCINAVKGIDIVFHCAAVLDENSRLLYKVNVQGTKNILEASAEARIKQFIFLSSVGVHGKAKDIISEETQTRPETKYEKTKAEAEKIVLEFQEVMPITIMRPALIMGANKQWAGIINAIKKNFPLPGNGKNAFQTIFVKDLVSALLFAINNENCFAETFIIAGREKPSLMELCLLIKKELGMPAEIKTIPAWIAKAVAFLNLAKNRLFRKKSFLEPAYISRILHERNYNTSKINALGWQQKYSLEEAIKQTIKELGK